MLPTEERSVAAFVARLLDHEQQIPGSIDFPLFIDSSLLCLLPRLQSPALSISLVQHLSLFHIVTALLPVEWCLRYSP